MRTESSINGETAEVKKVDLKKELKLFYQASAKDIRQIDVPTFRFLMVDGQGDPNHSQDFAQAVEALFAVAYAIKFMVKKGLPRIDYAVMPLEGLWWSDDPAAFTTDDRDRWKWTLMIMQPDFVGQPIVDAAIAEVATKKKLPGIAGLRCQAFSEGRCAQVLHLGPFSEEGPTIRRLHEFIDARSARSGKHHEIYLSDMRRTDPSKWKTILRQPMT